MRRNPKDIAIMYNADLTLTKGYVNPIEPMLLFDQNFIKNKYNEDLQKVKRNFEKNVIKDE